MDERLRQEYDTKISQLNETVKSLTEEVEFERAQREKIQRERLALWVELQRAVADRTYAVT